MDYLSPSAYLGGGSSSHSSSQPAPIPGSSYISTLHSYLTANASRIATPSSSKTSQEGSILQQSYTLLTLGLDPNSAPLSRSLVVPLSLGFAGSSAPSSRKASSSSAKPLTIRLPPDRLLYLLLRWQDLPQALPHVGKTDEPIPPGISTAARGARGGQDAGARKQEGDVQSVRSWVGSVRTASGQSSISKNYAPSRNSGWGSWWGSSRKELSEDEVLISLYTSFNLIPSLVIHPPLLSDPPIQELVENGAYTQLGGIDTKVPLNVLRNLQKLELEGYDPRCLVIPCMPGLKSLTITDVQDADDWLEDLVTLDDASRFPNLRYLATPSTSLLSLPALPLSHLAHLDLSGNLLDSLPSSLASLHTLVSLNLSANVITSVRNAPQVLGNITTLNLSKNRIDCLIGLERLLGLERLDVRGNELRESAEVGRLATLPHIREVWCESNPFEGYEEREAWRIGLAVAFIEENQGGDKEVVLDGQPWSWNEKRKIDQTLGAHGRHQRGRTTPAGSRPPSTYAQTSVRSTAPTLPSSTAASPAPVRKPQPKKRRKQRIVDLDGTARQTLPDDSGGSGSELEEASVKHSSLGTVLDPFPETDQAHPPQSQSLSKSAKPDRAKARRARVSASVYEPAATAMAPPASNGEDFRQQMEALKMEVGESWLKVLARNQAGQLAPAPITEETEATPSPAAEESGPAVVKVVKKSKKKSAAASADKRKV